jgi:hypothetical protein
MLRSALAVFAGIVVLTITSFAMEAIADPLLTSLFPQSLPNHAAINRSLLASLFSLTCTLLCIAAGGYVTAWLARRSPVRHAIIMGAIEVAFTVWAMISFPEQAPLRNWILTMIATVPAAWCGGAIRAKSIA